MLHPFARILKVCLQPLVLLQQALQLLVAVIRLSPRQLHLILQSRLDLTEGPLQL